MRHRFAFAALAVLSGGLLSGAAIAQAPAAAGDAQTTAATGGAAAAEPATRLQAGEIRADLLTLGSGKTLTAGSSAFAQIRLSTDAAGRKGVNADILVEAENGEVSAVAGTGVKTESEGKAVRARLEGLRRNRDRSLLVEVKLPAAPAAGRTTLKMTLRALPAPGKSGEPAAPAAEADTSISWSVKDCAGGYYAALQQIRDNADWRAGEKWKGAAKADDSLPKGWVFAPEEERRSRRRRGRGDVSALSKAERAILAEAGRLARAGRDPALDRDGDLGWVLGKVSADLDNYLSQPINPAICTGAIGMTDYYTRRLAALGTRGERLAQLAAEAKILAQTRVEAAFAAARALPEDTTGWSGVTPVSARSMNVRTDSLTGLAVSLAELAAIPGDAFAKVRTAQAPYAALTAVDEAGIEQDGMPDAVRKAVRAAFTAIDAAARIDAVQTRHKGVQAAFEGRITAIREAHAKHCTCGR
jgi:hypothetical protein